MRVDSLANNYSYHSVPHDYLTKWQIMMNTVARIFDVPSALIMRVHKDKIEVLVRSESEGNPYSPGDTEHLNMGLYCEKVMADRASLEVNYAPDDPGWADNPDIALNMNCYLGYPLIWPDGDVFGTICVLDSELHEFSQHYKELLNLFKEAIERDFEIFVQQQKLEEAYTALDRRSEELERAVQDLRAFSYTVSHDLRSPLRIVSGYGRLLEEELRTSQNGTAIKKLKAIQQAAVQMDQIIKDVLKLSQAESNELKMVATDISRLSQEIVESLQQDEPNRNIEIRIEPGMIDTVDPGLTRLLLANLIGNAWKFTRHQNPARIEIGRQADKKPQVFFVRDNGPGFNPADIDRMFQPFERLHTEQEFSGTGVGLATVKKVVTRHGGTIRAEGAPGEGAAFYFTLQPE